MTRPVRWTKKARKELSRLDVPTRSRILQAIDELAIENRGDVVRLHGLSETIYRLRVGGWRIFSAMKKRFRFWWSASALAEMLTRLELRAPIADVPWISAIDNLLITRRRRTGRKYSVSL